MPSADEMEMRFLKDETLDCEVYSRLAEGESSKEVKSLLQKLAATEKNHVRIWKTLLGARGRGRGKSALMGFRVFEMLIVRRLLGIAFVVKFLERHEKEDIKKYKESLSNRSVGGKYKESTKRIIRDFIMDERILTRKADNYKGELEHTQSIILGLNDGLVEILAIVAGLATVATTSFAVVLIGLIAGISGTLSMTGGVYLSSKSKGLLKNIKRKEKVTPLREAYRTGIWYLVGSLLAVLPFILGLSGLEGLSFSIVFVGAALAAVSAIIAVISETSFKSRAFEMLAISLGAAFVMMILGTLSKVYFGVSI